MGLLLTILLIIIIWVLWRYYKYKKQKSITIDSIGYEIDSYEEQNSILIDNRGYERDGFGKLVHRKVAFKHLYDYPKYPKRFRSYDVHHIDGNKLNNSKNNLQILTRKEHKKIHGK